METEDDPNRGQPDSMARKKKVGNYLLGKIVGEGAFSKVRQGLHIIAREKVAVKIVSKKAVVLRDYVKRSVRREAVLLQRLEHPNVIRLYEIMETENSYYLVMELAESGEFIKYLSERRRLCERECQKYIRQMSSALDHMHTSNIAHRDLKLENLLLDKDNNIKIIDFGLSNVFYGDTSLSTQCGSPVYAAPEIFCNKKYGPAVDVWSMGVCMYAMLTGKLPFVPDPPNNLTSLHTLILRGARIPSSLTLDCADLLSSMLAIDFRRRIKVEDILKHSWIGEDHTTPLLTRQPPIGKLYPHVPKTVIVTYMTTVFNFQEDDVFYSVMERKMNAVAATYHLLQRRFDSGLDLVGSSTDQAGNKGHHNTHTRRNGEIGNNWGNRLELPTLNRENTFASESGSQISRTTYKSYLQLLKDSKMRSAQSLRTTSQRHKDMVLRRQKTRGDLAKHTRTREETGFLPDFILTYTQDDHQSEKKMEKFEWEKSFIVSKNESKVESADGRYNVGSNVKAGAIDRGDSVDINREIHAPPTTPASVGVPDIVEGNGPSVGENMHSNDVKLVTSQDSKTLDQQMVQESGTIVNGSVLDPCNGESWEMFQKQKTRLSRGVMAPARRSGQIAYQYGVPITKPKTLTSRCGEKPYIEEIEAAQLAGRRLLERSKTTSGKIEELHSIWTRKSRTASSQREFPGLIAAPPPIVHPPAPTLPFNTVDSNGVIQFPDVVQQTRLLDTRSPSPPRQTFVDGVTDVIKVHITSSAKYSAV